VRNRRGSDRAAERGQHVRGPEAALRAQDHVLGEPRGDEFVAPIDAVLEIEPLLVPANEARPESKPLEPPEGPSKLNGD